MKKTLLAVPAARALTTVLIALVLLVPLSARSEIKKGSFEINPFAGKGMFEEKQNLKNEFIYGGRLGYNLTGSCALEAAVGFMNTSVDDPSLVGAAQGQYRSPMTDVDLTFYQIDAVHHFMPEGRLNPFVLAGIGAVHYSPKISDKDMSFVGLGVGAKYWLAERFALRIDVRDNLVFDETYNNFSATGGIVFSFGGGDKEEIVVVKEKAPEKVVVVVAEEPKVVEKVKVLAAEPKVVILAFEDVHFDFDKSTLTPEAKAILKRTTQILKENPKADIRIAGYTSAAGAGKYNQALSERRASAVKAYLVEEGLIPAGKLVTIGFGETSPAEYESAPKDLYSKAAKANMRVLFEIVVK